MDRKHELLTRYFGYTEFRGGQEELIDALAAGRDALGVMPTGGGKSLCYQIPALMLPGVTLVVSPLISLMKDQVMALKAAGVPAAYVNSSLTPEQIRKVCAYIGEGRYKIVYVAPERLITEGFLRAVGSIRVPLVAVDEAHCISEWGQDFRPSYLKIAEFIARLPRRPAVAAFTATATERVREDIERSLGLADPVKTVTGFDRPNLYYEVMRPREKMPALLALVGDRVRAGRSGIVYCSTRRQVEEVTEKLLAAGIPAAGYHAGMSDEDRQKNQEDFVYDRVRVMAATNAFGMGIDKSNVSFVIHYNMPKSLEEYYQEAGRAGRDGTAAECLLLYSPGDVRTARFLIENSRDTEDDEKTPEERERYIGQELKRLGIMTGYCKTAGCLRGYILGYFGQKHPNACGGCGNCLSDAVETDVTEDARAILGCVEHMRAYLGYHTGVTLVIQVLRGSREKRVTELHLDRLAAWGTKKDVPLPELRDLIDRMVDEGYLTIGEAYSTLEPGPRAAGLTAGTAHITVRRRKEPEKKKSPKKGAVLSVDAGTALYERLRELRGRISAKEGIPAYVVFSNASLMEMAARRPADMTEFLEISGVGAVKAQRYGRLFLAEINKET